MMVRRFALICFTGLISIIPAGQVFAGQVEYFSTGVANRSAGAYAGSIGFGVSNNGVVAATTNLGRMKKRSPIPQVLELMLWELRAGP